jgi:hypothetical protein
MSSQTSEGEAKLIFGPSVDLTFGLFGWIKTNWAIDEGSKTTPPKSLNQCLQDMMIEELFSVELNIWIGWYSVDTSKGWTPKTESL